MAPLRLNCLGLALLPFLTDNQRLASFSTFPFLLYLCARWPSFTTGDPSSDYYNNSHFIAIPLWYLDFVFLTPRDGEGAPAFIGSQATDWQRRDGKRWKDLATFSQRAKWACRLMLPAQRGVGWSWQVKGIPVDPDAKLPRWRYVSVQLWWTVFYYLQSVGALAALGLGCAWRAQSGPDDHVKRAAANAVVGWSGAVWVWDRLNCAYKLAAVLGVTTGATGTWEWPPLMGPLQDAWSVRQMWRYVYGKNGGSSTTHHDVAYIMIRSATYYQACRRVSGN
jgi:hypothetical protein